MADELLLLLQALLHCRRYEESEASAQQLPSGWDRQYLLAEVGPSIASAAGCT